MDKKRKVKKIAIVSRFVSGVTGTTTTILEHTRRLAELGWEVHIFGEKVAAGRVAAAGGETHILPRWPIGSYFKRRLFAWLFEREIRGEHFDLIRGHKQVRVPPVAGGLRPHSPGGDGMRRHAYRGRRDGHRPLEHDPIRSHCQATNVIGADRPIFHNAVRG